jgi:hypothetical protein
VQLLPRDRHESCRVNVVRSASQIAVQLHLPKPAEQKPVFEFAAGVNGVIEMKRPGSPIFDQDPLGVYAAPVVAQLPALHEPGTVGQIITACALPHPGESFLAEEFNHEHSTSFQACMHIAQDAKIILFILEISERGKDVARQIKAAGTAEPAHISFNPLDGQTRGGCAAARNIQQEPRTVYAGHIKAKLSKFQTMAPRTTTQIQHAAAFTPGERKDARNLFPGCGKALLGKHEWIQIPPELFVFKPFHGSKSVAETPGLLSRQKNEDA